MSPTAELADNPPCDSCPRTARCAARQMACSAFLLYAQGTGRVRWSLAPRTDPTREKFARVRKPIVTRTLKQAA